MKYTKLTKFRALAKTSILELQNFLELISRKISKLQKNPRNFHTFFPNVLKRYKMSNTAGNTKMYSCVLVYIISFFCYHRFLKSSLDAFAKNTLE